LHVSLSVWRGPHGLTFRLMQRRNTSLRPAVVGSPYAPGRQAVVATVSIRYDNVAVRYDNNISTLR
jgi:hypothetical protein